PEELLAIKFRVLNENKGTIRMKIALIVRSKVGSKTKIAMDHTLTGVMESNPEVVIILLDLAEYEIVFSNGRNYEEYDGETKYVAETIMSADAIMIRTPTSQPSIPATLKNIFDLLRVNAFRDKVVSTLVTAGSAKHYLMVEQQLKPILAYMKAVIVQTYVFIEEQDFHRGEIMNDDVLFRIERLVEDTVVLTETYAKIREEKEASYGF